MTAGEVVRVRSRPEAVVAGAVVLGLVGLVAWMCVGCGDSASAPAATETQTDGGAAAAPGWPRDFELPDGSTLTLRAPPRRVVPGSSGSLDMLAALLPPERLALIPAQAELYSCLRDPDSPYFARPRFSEYGAEALLSRDPDLVLAHSWQSADTTRLLLEAGVPVLHLADAHSWEGIASQLRLLGDLLDVADVADDVIADHEQRLAALVRDPADETWGALCYSNGGTGGMVAGTGTTNDEMLRLAGLRNLAAEQGLVGHQGLTFEELLVIDPPLLVVPGDDLAPSPTGTTGEPTGTAAVLATTPQLQGLRAVRNGHVIVVPHWLYTATGQHLVDGAERIVRALRHAGLVGRR